MAIANVVIKDSAAADHTFIPVADGKDARWVNSTGAVTLQGEETLGYSINRAGDKKTGNTARLTVWDPKEVTDPVTGLTSVSFGNSADCRFNFSPSADLTSKKDVVAMMKNWIIAFETKIYNLEVQL